MQGIMRKPKLCLVSTLTTLLVPEGQQHPLVCGVLKVLQRKDFGGSGEAGVMRKVFLEEVTFGFDGYGQVAW